MLLTRFHPHPGHHFPAPTNHIETEITPLRRAAQTIGVLLMVIGLLLFGGSVGLNVVSHKALKRYESGGGKFLRTVSAQDKGFYTYLRVLRVLTWILRPAGLIVLVAGAAVTAKPDILEPWLERTAKKPNGKDPGCSGS